jgi:hypothetical protein
MLIERMRKRLSADRASFIEPCLPSPADKPPSGSNWIHEIKHDRYRLMARRDALLVGGSGLNACAQPRRSSICSTARQLRSSAG